MNQKIITIEYWLVSAVLFVLPLFFLPNTFEFFATNKMYLAAYSSLVILMVATFRFFINRQFVWEKSILDFPVISFLTAGIVSTYFASENRIQSLLNPHSGLIMLVSLVVLYFYLSRQEWEKRSINLIGILIYSSCALAAASVLGFFGVFKVAGALTGLQFLQNPYFTPAGTLYDLIAVLGYFLIYMILNIVYSERADVAVPNSTIITTLVMSIGFAFALIMFFMMLAKPSVQTEFAGYAVSLKAAGYALTKPASFLIGVGIDDFSTAYTAVKDARLNLGSLWQADSFNLSRSALLQIMVETGIFGIVSFLSIFTALFYRIARSEYPHKLGPLILAAFVFILFLIFPLSPVLYFLAFITFAFTSCDLAAYEKAPKRFVVRFHKKKHIPVIYVIVLASFSILIAFGFLLGRSYFADAAFRASIDSADINNAHELYENQRQSVVLNPFIEQYRIQLAKTNVMIANEVAAAVQDTGKEATADQKRLIAEATQAAIAQAKAAVTLNPSKATNWEMLGTIYANVSGIVEQSSDWAVTSYSRAIKLDPTNARYHSKLGSVFYLAGRYSDAINAFIRSTELKPDWASAWFNLAWSYHKNKNTESAIKAMTRASQLIDRVASPDDYRQAMADLETFRMQEN